MPTGNGRRYPATVDWASEPGAAGRAIRTVSAVAAVVIALTVALHRGLFSHPGWQWLALVAAVAPFVVDLRWPPRRAWAAIALLGVSVAGLAALIVVEPRGPDISLLLLLVVAARVGAGAPARVSVPVGLAAIALLVYLDVARPGVTSVAMIIGLAFAWSAGLAMRMQAWRSFVGQPRYGGCHVRLVYRRRIGSPCNI